MDKKLTPKIFVLLVFLTVLVMPAASMAQEMIPSVTVADQEIVDGKVTITKVVSSGPGWLVIHIDDNGGPGPVIGQSPVVDGENTAVVVEIDQAQATETLYAMLHTDAGTVGTYEFPGPDAPAMVNGQMVTPGFKVVSAMMEGEPMVEGAMESKEEGAMMEGEAKEEGAMMEGEQAMAAAVACETDYSVQADDWLSKIADKFYGDVLAFPAIVEATNAWSKGAMMAGDQAMAGEAMAGEAMMAEGKLMVQGADGSMMEATLEPDGQMMVTGADGQMMDVSIDQAGMLMMADGSMVEGKLILEGADGQMMDVSMGEDGKLMVTVADGSMMEVAMGDQAMAEGEAMMEEDKAMAEGEAMMAGGYALIENPDIIEPGWTLCIPSAEDAQKLLSGGAMMEEGAMMEGESK